MLFPYCVYATTEVELGIRPDTCSVVVCIVFKYTVYHDTLLEPVLLLLLI